MNTVFLNILSRNYWLCSGDIYIVICVFFSPIVINRIEDSQRLRDEGKEDKCYEDNQANFHLLH